MVRIGVNPCILERDGLLDRLAGRQQTTADQMQRRRTVLLALLLLERQHHREQRPQIVDSDAIFPCERGAEHRIASLEEKEGKDSKRTT